MQAKALDPGTDALPQQASDEVGPVIVLAILAVVEGVQVLLGPV